MKVPIARTQLTDSDLASVVEPLRSGWLVQGPFVRQFEDMWSEFTGVEHSIAVTSCTSALHMSLIALGVGPGDEVIVPAFTWVATANVVELVGATTVLCDIQLDDFNIDVDALERLITDRTKAIIPVHLFGRPAKMDRILELASSRGIKVVEDAACGFGSRVNGKHVGGFGDTGCFSFHPRKSITTGEGGMITTNDPALAEHLRQLRDHGAMVSDLQRHLGPRPYLLADHGVAGMNQRMTDIQAALGVSQMRRADEILRERNGLAQILIDGLSDLACLRLPKNGGPTEVNGWQSFPSIFRPDLVASGEIEECNHLRNEFMSRLDAEGIATRPATHAVHLLRFFREKYGLSPDDRPSAYAADKCSISLPLFNGMTHYEVEHIINTVRLVSAEFASSKNLT